MFFERLNSKYKTSKADDSNVYLGIRCRRLAPHVMFLDQEPHVTVFLHMYGFAELRPVSTPTSGLPLSKDQQPVEQSEKDAMKKHPYFHIVGSLRYLEQCTRPDISFALNRLIRYQSNPGLPHWQELKHLCRYTGFSWYVRDGGGGRWHAGHGCFGGNSERSLSGNESNLKLSLLLRKHLAPLAGVQCRSGPRGNRTALAK